MKESKVLLLLIVLCLAFGACQKEDEYVIFTGKHLKEIVYVDRATDDQYTFSFEYDAITGLAR